MKKYTLIGLIGLLLVVGVGAYLWQADKLPFPPEISLGGQQQRQASSLRGYVPAEVDQLLYMQVDDELIAVAQKMQETQGLDDALDDVLAPLDELIVYQYSSGVSVTNLLFLQGSDELSVQEIQNLGVVNDAEGFVYDQLSDNTWVYGDAAALASYQSYKGTYASDREEIKKFLQAYRAGEYNLGFFSTPLQDMPTTNPLVGTFSQQLQYTMALSRMRLDNPFGRVVMQFEDGVIQGTPEGFVSKLASYSDEEAILYLEMANLFSLVGIDDQQIQLFLPVLLGQNNPALGSLLSTDDYAILSQALRDNIALSLTSQDGVLGAGLQIVFSSPDVFPVLAKLAPLRKGLAAPLGGAENIQESVTDDQITFSLGGAAGGTGVFAALPPMPLITVARNEDVSYITLFQEDIVVSEQGVVVPSTDRTRLVFRFDNQKLLEALQNSPLFQVSQQVPMNENFFEGGVVVGSVNAIPENNQLTISFSVE